MKLLSFKQNCYLKPLLMLCFFILFLSTSGIVSAASGDEDVIGSKLCDIVGILRGRTAKAICLIAIIVLGITVFAGRVNWSTAMITVIAIIIITQAPAVLKFVSGSEANDCTTKPS